MFPSFVIPDSVVPIGYQIVNSLRYNGSSSRFNIGAPAGRSLVKTTLNGWFKFEPLTSMTLMGSGSSNAAYNLVAVLATGEIQFYFANSTPTVLGSIKTVAKFIDPTAWYNVHVVFDSANAVATDRMQIWVNGVRQAVTILTQCALNAALFANLWLYIGTRQISGTFSAYMDGYAAQAYLIDNQVLSPVGNFGDFDPVTDQFVPIEYPLAFGTRDMFYEFKNGGTVTTLGADSSGNGYSATLTGMTRAAGSSDCWFTDTPTKNFCTLNNLWATGTISNGALTYAQGATPNANARGNFAIKPNTGKWYWEYQIASAVQSGVCGICNANLPTNVQANLNANAWAYVGTGLKYIAGVSSAYGATWTSTSVIGIVYDSTALTLQFYKDGVAQPLITGIPADTYFPLATQASATSYTGYSNFGQRLFAQAVPAECKTLDVTNLDEVVITSGSFLGNANVSGPTVWMNGTPETLTIDSVVVPAANYDALANGFKLRASYTAVQHPWSATILSPASDSAFKNRNAQSN